MTDQRIFILRNKVVLKTAVNAINNLPIDETRPFEVVIMPHSKKRNRDQNALAWAGLLKDFEQQAYFEGRTFSSAIWHEHLKREFLPEVAEELITSNDYVKWSYLPDGERILTGSTTKLSVKGFSQYLDQCYCFGADLGIQFTAKPNNHQ